VPCPASPAIRRKPAPSPVSPTLTEPSVMVPPTGAAPPSQSQKMMAYSPAGDQAQQLPTPPYTQYTPPQQDQGRYGPPWAYPGGEQTKGQSTPTTYQALSQGHVQSPEVFQAYPGGNHSKIPSVSSASSPPRPQLRQYQAYPSDPGSQPSRPQQQQQQTFPARDNRTSFQPIPATHSSKEPDPRRISQQLIPGRPGLEQSSSSPTPQSMPGNGAPQQASFGPQNMPGHGNRQQTGYGTNDSHDDRPRRPQQRMTFGAQDDLHQHPSGMRPGMQERASFGPTGTGGLRNGPGPGPGPGPGQSPAHWPGPGQLQRPLYDPKY
jgi:hypothetical protein